MSATPTRADSPVIPQQPGNIRKRKHGGANTTSTPATPEPTLPGSEHLPGTIVPVPEAVVLPGRHVLASRQRLSISRFPTFPEDGREGEYYTTEQIVQNQLGFRYTPAGIAEPGAALQVRTIESHPTYYRVSWEDRSPFIRVTPDGLGLQGDKGFRTARCNAPVREGRWYMEVQIELGGGDRDPSSAYAALKEGAHVRLGWGRREAPLNGPVGVDGYSYGIRDKTGEKTTLSRPKPYCQHFGSGDTVGMYISLPPRRKPNPKDPSDPAHIKRERIPLDYKGQEYFESLEYTQSKEMNHIMDQAGKILQLAASNPSKKSASSLASRDRPGRGAKPDSPATAQLRPLTTLGTESMIAFFINGVSQGVAYQDLYDFLPLKPTNKTKVKDRGKHRSHRENFHDDGTLGYYPSISLFNGARVRLNPGPEFAFPPPVDIEAILTDGKPISSKERNWKPLCLRYTDYMAEQWDLDKIDEAEAQITMELDAVKEEEEEEARRVKERKAALAAERRKAKKAESDRIESAIKHADQNLARVLAESHADSLAEDTTSMSQTLTPNEPVFQVPVNIEIQMPIDGCISTPPTPFAVDVDPIGSESEVLRPNSQAAVRDMGVFTSSESISQLGDFISEDQSLTAR